MTGFDDATLAQVEAARPDASTWLAANAGSGKTRVLTDRVARLLLDGVQPQHILCLTYTKAAASEMQNRLFRRLGEWAMLHDDDLRASLRGLGITTEVDTARLRDARTLFARAIETPGGLKIQTIHSFCASLLRRFPLEARVSPQFKEVEDRAADLLRAEIVDAMADGPEADLVRDLATHCTAEDFEKLTRAVVQRRADFAQPRELADFLQLFDQPPDLTFEKIEASVFLGDEQDILDQMIPPMLAKGGNDEKAARALAEISDLEFSALPALERVFLTGPKANAPFSAKLGSFPTKPTQAKLGPLMPALNDFMQRIEDARPARIGLLAAQKSTALQAFATAFLRHYEDEKTRRGWLDFDDLIEKARQLLTDENVAAWVLFRIDGGIDHILVDEAQDTSPAQWDVIRKLAAEFTSGQGARADVPRTIFVVGDKKQSIYSFQGADPGEFDQMQDEFEKKTKAAQQNFQSRTLLYSFRSSEAVLRLVDHTFEGQEDAGFNADADHKAFKAALPGRVDLWPVIPVQKDDDDRAWFEPLDRKSPTHHMMLLADRIASQIKQMIDSREMVPVDVENGKSHAKRPVRAGDFLILVQRRSALFVEIIRACKAHGLPIAGADRLKVGGELAVRDLAALLSFLAVPEDDLSLASALKSPLFGWSEQDLYTLTRGGSGEYLWEKLRKREDDYPGTLKVLHDLRAKMDFLRPFDLIERVLTRHKGRRNLLARLGSEAEDGINALLSQALAYERNAVPSLTGFLVWMETDDLEIKRQIDSASDQIRVMTVHGAKGLEAPVVILPDTGKRAVAIKDDILRVDGVPVWKTSGEDMPLAMSNTVDGMRRAEMNERLRLLYVALTRAEKWLIVAAAGDLPTSEKCWYQLVEDAMDTLGAAQVDHLGMDIRRVSHADWDALTEVTQNTTAPESVTLEPFFRDVARAPAARRKVIAPSDLEGDKALPGPGLRDEEAAKAYGTQVHHYLEHFSAAPEKDWPALAEALKLPACPPADHAEARTEAARVLTAPHLGHLFGPDSLSEVAITAEFGTARLNGKIDRLVIGAEKVLAVDFKTNQVVPARTEDCPEGILRQMAAYAHALAQVYPDRKIEVAILWARDATLMPVPHDMVMHLLHSTPYLDAGTEAS